MLKKNRRNTSKIPKENRRNIRASEKRKKARRTKQRDKKRRKGKRLR